MRSEHAMARPVYRAWIAMRTAEVAHARQHLLSSRQSPPAGRVRQPPHLRSPGELRPHRLHGRRPGLHRSRHLLLHRHRRRRGPARLLVQGRRAGFRARDGRQRAGVSRLRRQRHVQEPRQPARQSQCRAAVHRHARAPAAPARQRHGQRVARRPPARPHRRRAAHRARRGQRHLSQLPALHSQARTRRAVGLRAAAGRRPGGAGLEGL